MVTLLSSSDKLRDLNEKVSETPPEKFSTTDNVLQLIGLCLLLVIILAAAYYTTRLVGRYKLGQLKDSNFKVVDSYRISPNKMLQIVKIGHKYVVIGIGKDQISYITELSENEIIPKEVYEGQKQSFRQILEKLRNKKE